MCVCVWGGGGGGAPKVTLILSYIRMLGPFMGFIFVIFNIVGALGGGGGCEYLWVSLQNWTIFWVIPMCFMVFSQGECIVNSIFGGGGGGG